MKVNYLSALVIGAAVLTSGCLSKDPNIFSSPVNYTAEQKITDGKILGAMIALNKNEIAAAALAARKATNKSVQDFAQWMTQSHSQNLQQTEALSQRLNIPPVNGEAAMMLQRNGKRGLTSLSHLSNAAFNRAYMAAMVKGHQEAYALINQRLLPSTTNPMIISDLKATSVHVNQHLQKAKMVLAQQNKTSHLR